MGRKAKFYNRFLQNPSNVKYAQLRTLLELCGYTLRPSSGGSHRWFTKKGCPPIHFPEHRPVGKKYVNDVLKILEEYCDLDDES